MLVFPMPEAACFVPHYQRSFIIVCYCCADVWAVCNKDIPTDFQVNVEICPKCAYEPGWSQPTDWRTPGSVLESIMRGMYQQDFEDSQQFIPQVLDCLPPHVIRSEFNTALKAFSFNRSPSYLL